MEEFIQVGVTAARDPMTGDYLPAVPLFIQATDAAAKSADDLIEDIQSLFAARYALTDTRQKRQASRFRNPPKGGFMPGKDGRYQKSERKVKAFFTDDQKGCASDPRRAVQFRAPALYLRGMALTCAFPIRSFVRVARMIEADVTPVSAVQFRAPAPVKAPLRLRVLFVRKNQGNDSPASSHAVQCTVLF